MGAKGDVELKRFWLVPLAAISAWFAFSYAAIRPLADAPVVDSWIYADAARWLAATGSVRFAGYTEAMPVGQVAYGAAWAWLFGSSDASLDLSVMMMAILGGWLFWCLAKRCGANRWQALLATGLLVCNPCYVFLSFSFMTEIPFVTLMVAAYLAYANADGDHETRWYWASALLGVAAFSIRPFGAAAILGCAGASMLDVSSGRPRMRSGAFCLRIVAPFAVGIAACGAIWIWLTVIRTPPWDLANRGGDFAHLLDVPVSGYLRAGLFSPALYLGLVLAPLAIWQTRSRGRWLDTALIGLAIATGTIFLMRLEPHPSATPALTCFGGWRDAFGLYGGAEHFAWDGPWQWLVIAAGSIGAAGLVVAMAHVAQLMSRAIAAVLLGAAAYWVGTIPLWFFNDRYDLLLVPAGCLLVALAPLPRPRIAMAAGCVMVAAMGLLSLGGVYSHQRGLAELVAARDALIRSGIPRERIDAGYPLNGEDLYRYAACGADDEAREAGIPMITAGGLSEFTLSRTRHRGARVLRRLSFPGPFGFGEREIYLLRKLPDHPTIHLKTASHPQQKHT
ncbi:MAG: ArnT family glycosyltransferase [Candidatus Binataceae bacterium]